MAETHVANSTINVDTPEFDKSVFCLSHPVNKFNLSIFNFNGFKLHKLENDVYTLPVKIDGQKSMFMIISPKIFTNKWAVFFCLGHVNSNHEVITFNINQGKVMTTGRGLNYLGQVNPKLANKLLKYFSSLAGIKKGSWHQIQLK